MRIPTAALRQRVTVTRPGENLGDGPTPGAEVTVRARVDWGSKLMRAEDGTEVVTTGVFLCRPGVDVQPGDTATVPGDTQGRVRTVFAVNPSYTPTGRVRHLAVFFQ